MTQVNLSRPPRLITAPSEYDKAFHDQNNDVLRLYFTQLDNALNTLLRPRGGQYLSTPNASLRRSSDTTLTANTPAQVIFGQADAASGVTLNSGTISVEQSGVYCMTSRVQMANSGATPANAWVWVRKNGADLADSAAQITVPPAGSTVVTTSVSTSLLASDTLQVWVAAESAAIYLLSVASATSPFARPAIPAAIATLSFVSNLTA